MIVRPSCAALAPLDRYLREQASQDVKRLSASCFVAVETATNMIAGFYTLCGDKHSGRRTTAGHSQTSAALPALAGRAGRPSRGRSALSPQGTWRRRCLPTRRFAFFKGDVKALGSSSSRTKDENAVAFYRLQGFQPFATRPLSRSSCPSEPSKRERRHHD